MSKRKWPQTPNSPASPEEAATSPDGRAGGRPDPDPAPSLPAGRAGSDSAAGLATGPKAGLGADLAAGSGTRLGAGLGGRLKERPEDFQVREIRPEPPSGEGEHWVVTIEKRGLTTEQAVAWLARAFDLPKRAVGYAGLKDRWAVTTQDLSIHDPGAPGTEPLDLAALTASAPEGLRVLGAVRHRRKIRIGHLAGNRFLIRLRGARNGPEDRERAAAVAERIRRQGVPNAFGAQRFGRHGDNAARGRALLAGQRLRVSRHERGLLLSAVRSDLFNRLLAARLERGWFERLLDGDVAQLAGRSACFAVESAQAEQARFAAGEIHPTGPLFGKGMLTPTGEPGALEERIAEEEQETVDRLVAMGMTGERRALRVIPGELALDWTDDDLVVAFTLPRGAYATTVMAAFTDPPPEAPAGQTGKETASPSPAQPESALDVEGHSVDGAGPGFLKSGSGFEPSRDGGHEKG